MQKPTHSRDSSLPVYTFALIYFAAITFLGNELDRNQTSWLMISYAVAFFAYFWLVRITQLSTNTFLIIGILTRLTLFFSLPNLSDDFYRFVWDGTLLLNGQNPYALLPREALALGLEGLSEDFLNKLNSPDYYSVYPPLNQAIFWLSASLGGLDKLLVSVGTIRLFLLLGDVAAFFALQHLGRLLDRPMKNLVFWYFLNPLVVLEFTGNLHFEGLVIAGMLWAVVGYHHSKLSGQIAGLSIGIATKLIPLIFLPAFLFRQWSKRGVVVTVGVAILSTLLFAPLLGTALFKGMSTSLGLYFQSFEFNGSIYLIFREIGFATKGYNVIQTLGPRLAMATFLLVTAWSLYGAIKKLPLVTILLFSLQIHWLLSTTVHPWYILSMIPLGLLGGFNFPVVWSLAIFITYSGYSNEGFELAPFWIVSEYVVVLGYMIIEITKKYVDPQK